jgi:hypothetical protein
LRRGPVFEANRNIVRPLAIFLGIAMGSAVSLFAGIAMTSAVFLLLPEYRTRLGGEQGPLMVALAWSTALTVTSSVAFVGEVRARTWRRPVQLVLVGVLGGMVWHYWPR